MAVSRLGSNHLKVPSVVNNGKSGNLSTWKNSSQTCSLDVELECEEVSSLVDKHAETTVIRSPCRQSSNGQRKSQERNFSSVKKHETLQKVKKPGRASISSNIGHRKVDGTKHGEQRSTAYNTRKRKLVQNKAGEEDESDLLREKVQKSQTSCILEVGNLTRRDQQYGSAPLCSCDYCNFSCDSFSELMHHQKILHKNKHNLFSCNYCDFTCTQASSLSLHIMSVHNDECKFSCAQCNMKFSHIRYLKRHLSSHLDLSDIPRAAKYTQFVSCKAFETKTKYTKHVIKNKHAKLYRCLWCKFSTNEVSQLCDHRYQHMTDKGFVCMECDSMFPSVTEHELHMLMYHEQKYLDRICTKTVCPCRLCDKMFQRVSDLKQHALTAHLSDCSFDVTDIHIMEQNRPDPEQKYLCSTCGTFLRSAKALKVHKCKGLKSSMFSCSTCQRKFPTRAQMKSHEYVHTGQKPFSCSQCSYRCRRMQYLKCHMLIHSGEKTHLCTVCGESFTFLGALKRHMHKHSSEQPFSCSVCSFTTSDPNGLTRHMVKHIINLFSCEKCSFTCMRQIELEKHKLTHVQNGLIPCSSCQQTFTNLKELQAHMLTHLDRRHPNYICNFCSFTCQVQKDYIIHMQTHSIDKPFACTVCDYRSNRRMNLKVHMRKQHNMSLMSVVSFTCKVCQFTCERDQDFIKHMLVSHAIDKPFDCPVCPFATHRQGLLKVHMETHKPHGFFCQLCNFKCKRKTLLNKHMMKKHLRHSSDENATPANEQKPYACKFCDFVSKHYASLRNHMPVHSDVKFPCDECSYVTYSQRNLASHKRSHVKDKPFKCPFCQYASARKNNFKLHMVRHKDEKLYCCNKCDFTTISETDLTSHVTDNHDEMSAVSDIPADVITIFHTSGQNSTTNMKPAHSMTSNSIDLFTRQSEGPPKSLSLEQPYISSHGYYNYYRTDISNVLSDTVNQNNQENTGVAYQLTFVPPAKEPPTQSLHKEYICHNQCRSGDFADKLETQERKSLLAVHSLTNDSNEDVANQHQREAPLAPYSFIPSGEIETPHNQIEFPQTDNISLAQTGNMAVLNDLPRYIYAPIQSISTPYASHNAEENVMSSEMEVYVTDDAMKSQDQPLSFDYSSKDARDFSQHLANLWDGNVYSCRICSFKCSSELELTQHSATHSITTHRREVANVCAHCKLSFNTCEDLDRHNLQFHFETELSEDHHHQQNLSKTYDCQIQSKTCSTGESTQVKGKVYTCSSCGFNCDRSCDFKRHMLTAHGIEKAFSCKLCSYSTKREDDLKTHAITHDEAMIRSCSVCDYTCKRIPALRKHMRKHTDIKLFACHLCDFWCNYEPDLRSHIVKAHEKPRHFTCPLCQFTTDFAIHYKKHMSTAHAIENAFKCPHCDYSTSLWNNFRAHRLKHSSVKKCTCTCKICGQSFKRSSSLKNHMQIHSDSKLFGCTKCKYVCDDQRKLKYHMQKHTTGHPFACRLCQRSYTHSSSLYKHISLVHKNAKRHICSWCSYSTSTLSLLKRHLLTHGVGKRFICSVCQFTCNHKEVLENHKLVHDPNIHMNGSDNQVTSSSLLTHKVFSEMTLPKGSSTESLKIDNVRYPCNGPSKFTCVTCNHTFSSTSNYKKHMLRHKRSQYVSKFFCSVCEFSCLRPFELKIHTSIHTGEKPFSCDQCEFACCKPYTLKYHKERKHGQGDHAQHQSCGTFSCHLCDFTSAKHIHLKYHIQAKHEKVLADVKSMESVHSLHSTLPSTSADGISLVDQESRDSIHNDTDTGKTVSRTISSSGSTSEKQFICDLCNYSTRNKGNLITHLQKHESKKYLCHLCDYMCRRERELMRHLMTHERGKPLSCSLCSYTCIQPASLKVHMLKHKGDRPIQCKLCSFRCRQQSTLRDHMTTHSDERKFACELCDYRAKRAISLKMHMYTHSSERPVCCTLCDFTCKHANALRSHMRSHARDNIQS